MFVYQFDIRASLQGEHQCKRQFYVATSDPYIYTLPSTTRVNHAPTDCPLSNVDNN